MNEDYLWDKSGEPDPEIERLENRLGRLRYKRPVEPLPLPATPRLSFRHSFPPVLAAAAALVLLLLAGGLWLGLRRAGSTEGQSTLATGAAPEEKQIRQTVSVPHPSPGSGSGDDQITQGGDSPVIAPLSPDTRRNKTHRRSPGTRQEIAQLAKANKQNRARRQQQTIRDGELAKEQLIKALHLASDKLNTVQRKIQASQERSPVL